MIDAGEWIDDACEGAAKLINDMFAAIQAEAAVWEPAPCPVNPRVLSRVDGEVFGDDPLLRG